MLFNFRGGTTPRQGTLNISVTQSTLSAAVFVVSDDTGFNVGAPPSPSMGKPMASRSLTFPDITINSTSPTPYLSDFLPDYLHQRYRTPVPGSDFMTSYREWPQMRTAYFPGIPTLEILSGAPSETVAIWPNGCITILIIRRFSTPY